MNFGDRITLNRACEVIQIPSGMSSSLPAGTAVRIMQSRGNSYTVATDFGEMFRVDIDNADALGLSGAAAQTPAVHQEAFSEQMVWDQMKTIYDPEIPVHIVDLGLIYSSEIAPTDEGWKNIDIKMSMTARDAAWATCLKL